eukprot:1365363-Alexandrium_andersonii.AAC.1
MPAAYADFHCSLQTSVGWFAIQAARERYCAQCLTSESGGLPLCPLLHSFSASVAEWRFETLVHAVTEVLALEVAVRPFWKFQKLTLGRGPAAEKANDGVAG